MEFPEVMREHRYRYTDRTERSEMEDEITIHCTAFVCQSSINPSNHLTTTTTITFLLLTPRMAHNLVPHFVHTNNKKYCIYKSKGSDKKRHQNGWGHGELGTYSDHLTPSTKVSERWTIRSCFCRNSTSGAWKMQWSRSAKYTSRRPAGENKQWMSGLSRKANWYLRPYNVEKWLHTKYKLHSKVLGPRWKL